MGAAVAMGVTSIVGGVAGAFAGREEAHQIRGLTEEKIAALQEDRINLAVQSRIQRDLAADNFKRAADAVAAAAGAAGVSQTSGSVIDALIDNAVEQAREDAMILLEERQRDEALQRQVDITFEEGRAAERRSRTSGVSGIFSGVGDIVGSLF